MHGVKTIQNKASTDIKHGLQISMEIRYATEMGMHAAKPAL